MHACGRSSLTPSSDHSQLTASGCTWKLTIRMAKHPLAATSCWCFVPGFVLLLRYPLIPFRGKFCIMDVVIGDKKSQSNSERQIRAFRRYPMLRIGLDSAINPAIGNEGGEDELDGSWFCCCLCAWWDGAMSFCFSISCFRR